MFLTLKEPKQQSAILIDGNESRREMFQLMLGSRNISLETCYTSIDSAIADQAEPELAIVYFERMDRSELVDLSRLRSCKTCAVLALIEEADATDIETLLETGADHVLPLGLQSDRFNIAAVSALAQARKHRQMELDKTRAEEALNDAKRVARAKMILIARHGIDEVEAHRRVQQLSMERNLPLAEMAGQIIEAESLLC
ncbi:ANTAR domain-containing protein [Aliishimia ponticola]|uniref:ANTAR domain-containing protein n=1 Tax=Aliishimia ponticola TaxID=2499833 RepID=A0A4S4NIY9_9RHOB|nr:ANTAR domain-containing protein [Aliishimia ponticola]THH36060.1 ANTAR domain-containing protein [Aliishimia ponticola]